MLDPQLFGPLFLLFLASTSACSSSEPANRAGGRAGGMDMNTSGRGGAWLRLHGGRGGTRAFAGQSTCTTGGEEGAGGCTSCVSLPFALSFEVVELVCFSGLPSQLAKGRQLRPPPFLRQVGSSLECGSSEPDVDVYTGASRFLNAQLLVGHRNFGQLIVGNESPDLSPCHQLRLPGLSLVWVLVDGFGPDVDVGSRASLFLNVELWPTQCRPLPPGPPGLGACRRPWSFSKPLASCAFCCFGWRRSSGGSSGGSGGGISSFCFSFGFNSALRVATHDSLAVGWTTCENADDPMCPFHPKSPARRVPRGPR
eukprot:CAMPEP_0206469004 /NCGR_PEP_ID=MMETSP0324_2-20121206/29995_1 /ASSEMBLY_ACC=CAM_ASM_000836 /TAXON_ID=2866 /ORGANISM="Crypthecodinium cohnii, Strain Seligo" /LENGTH=310 /DNA_ID=CAMNT_0053942627 /DNA_START=109 /DNA_END=1038 /DNA_ORIENTATION=-